MITGTMTRYRNATASEKAMRINSAILKQERARDDELKAAYQLLDEERAEQFNGWYNKKQAA